MFAMYLADDNVGASLSVGFLIGRKICYPRLTMSLFDTQRTYNWIFGNGLLRVPTSFILGISLTALGRSAMACFDVFFAANHWALSHTLLIIFEIFDNSLFFNPMLYFQTTSTSYPSTSTSISCAIFNSSLLIRLSRATVPFGHRPAPPHLHISQTYAGDSMAPNRAPILSYLDAWNIQHAIENFASCFAPNYRLQYSHALR